MIVLGFILIVLGFNFDCSGFHICIVVTGFHSRRGLGGFTVLLVLLLVRTVILELDLKSGQGFYVSEGPNLV